MEGLLYVLVPTIILGTSWGLRVMAVKTMKENCEANNESSKKK